MLKQQLLLILILSFTLSNAVDSEKHPSIIIVGAGAAGIAAAAKLFENNFNNITILEAENRYGGRIFTTQFGNGIFDLGAQWCHGRKDNVVYELAKDTGLLETEIDQVVYFKFSACYSSGKKIEPAFLEETYGIFWNIYENDKPAEEISLGEYLPKRYEGIIKDTYGDDIEKVTIALDLLDTFIKAALSYDGAFSILDVSVNGDYESCEGRDLYWKKSGYSSILDILTHGYPDKTKQLPVFSNTLLNKEVVKISWGQNGETPVTVECLDDSSYSADYVIVTPSLGVLKDRYKTLFDPPLPAKKQEIIEDLGIAAVIKMLISYEEPWWPSTNFSGFSFVWTKKDRQNLLEEYPKGPVENDRSWLLDVLGAYTISERPNYLMVWIAGPLVPKIELLSDKEILEGFNFLLKKFVGIEYQIPASNGTIRNNWYSNKHFRGTYSYQTVESRKHNVSPEIILSEPLKLNDGKLKVFFAGEATNPVHYSTVHGAIESGQREAGRIINLHK